MAVDDLWYLSKQRGPDGERLPSRRHGKGKRYRVRYVDAGGEGRERHFALKRDANAFDLEARSGSAPEGWLSQAAQRQTFQEYAERWRSSRRNAQSLDSQRYADTRLRNHLYPILGSRPIKSITVTDVHEWIDTRRELGAAYSSIRTYFDLLNVIMNAAVTDKIRTDNPCKGVRLSKVLRGLSRSPKWVPNTEQVGALFDVVPPQLQAAIWLGAGEGMRLGEVLGIETGTRCVDYLRREIHVVQQLNFHIAEYGGFYLAPPKGGVTGDVDLDDHVGAVLGEHIRKYPPTAVTLPDITKGAPEPGKKPLRRSVELLFTDDQGRPISDQRWGELWCGWRTAAGWPKGGTFHSLRHYFATTLITQHVDPPEVQRALRHASLAFTLEQYVHWWPKAERRRSVISGVLASARQRPEIVAQ